MGKTTAVQGCSDGMGDQPLGSHLRKVLSFSGTAGAWNYCHLVGVKRLEGY